MVYTILRRSIFIQRFFFVVIVVFPFALTFKTVTVTHVVMKSLLKSWYKFLLFTYFIWVWLKENV